MTLADVFTVVMTLAGVFFYFAGSLGLWRFPDVYCRLHALTKADNLGLGLIVFGMLPQVQSWVDGVQLLVIWLMVMLVSAVTCYLVAGQVNRSNATNQLTQDRYDKH
jgi:multicomponent Na+:H+ antiporter subunit G